jgi:hypothetical protein
MANNVQGCPQTADIFHEHCLSILKDNLQHVLVTANSEHCSPDNVRRVNLALRVNFLELLDTKFMLATVCNIKMQCMIYMKCIPDVGHKINVGHICLCSGSCHS